jgi:virginiamycin B lyase
LGQVTGLAVGGGYLYWADDGRNSIGRAYADGSKPDASFIAGTDGPTGIAVYGGFIYWAAGTGSTGVIERASLNGSGVKPAFITGTRSAGGVAAG